MPDDPNQAGAQDRSRINIEEAHEVRYWTQRFGVSEQALREAVAKVGVSAQAVAEHLGRK